MKRVAADAAARSSVPRQQAAQAIAELGRDVLVPGDELRNLVPAVAEEDALLRSRTVFGQTLKRTVSTQSAQKVHSWLQMRASCAFGGKSFSQYSQFGRSSSIARLHEGQTGQVKPPLDAVPLI